MPHRVVTRRVPCNAAHRLLNPRCSDAENYVLEIERLKELVGDRVVRQLDPKHLNLDVPWLADLNPTAENIAVVCRRAVAPAPKPAALQRIRLWETDRNSVDYHGA